MKNLTLLAAAAAIAVSGAASAAMMSNAPSDSWTVSNYYKQTVYDPNQAKVGEIDDVLVNKTGEITGLVVSVGGFLGMDAKDVIVPFSDVSLQKKDDKYWLSINETKDSLKSAQGFTYDRQTTMWRPAKS